MASLSCCRRQRFLHPYWPDRRSTLQAPCRQWQGPDQAAADSQEVLNGPHTRVRVDAIAAPAAGPAQVSPQGKKKEKGGRQMGLSNFYKGVLPSLLHAPFMLCPLLLEPS